MEVFVGKNDGPEPCILLLKKTAANQYFDGVLKGGARHHQSGVKAVAGGKGVNIFAVGAATKKLRGQAKNKHLKTFGKQRKSKVKPRKKIGKPLKNQRKSEVNLAESWENL